MYANSPYREIRALHDDEFIRVYQAYNENIANLAAKANSFEPARLAKYWSPNRTTWIKPSAVWMAYRCGWSTMKDENQARVLALDLSRPKFENMMLGACLASDVQNKSPASEKPPIVVQWDPEREMCGNVPGNQIYTRGLSRVRSIQIGFRDSAVKMLLDPSFVLRITDVTNDFRQAANLLNNNDIEGASKILWKNGPEKPMKISEELKEVLGMIKIAKPDSQHLSKDIFSKRNPKNNL